MHVSSAQFTNFKRFTDLKIEGLPQSARLVVLTGPNGSGKSAIFEGFNWYRRDFGGWGQVHDPAYFPKTDRAGRPSCISKRDHPVPRGQAS
ncbi:MAG: AAA family ATPase [Acidimicrobiia bacterium]|nr:AAA family ATPase [Acidimicrobiia bacterium]MXZ79419.1 AAA family ATPase [Acidimicrobiia bacterium]MYB72508.1 AAA family ATPase [Acidimicrobiia bacterium]MYE72026.1 AAA family ATPase [Acidimicrobiia bacterium]MYI00055.1 AAA family ATPase [Acidimicrobiia bacterium]